MINIDDYKGSCSEQYSWESDNQYNRRLRGWAIQAELEIASSDARSGNYEEAILHLVDIIETLQETS